MMMPAPATALATTPYSLNSGIASPTLHPGLPQLDAAYAAAAAANLQPPAKDTTWTKLFVGGLPYTTTDQELREFFEEFGEIEEAAVIIDRQTGKSKGYGFVTMADTKAAARAVQNPNPIIQGRKSNVNYAFIGAKQNYQSGRALLATEAYTGAATNALRYHAYLPASPYGAKGTYRPKILRGPPGTAITQRPIPGQYRTTPGAAGTVLYSPSTAMAAASYGLMPAAAPAMPGTALPVQSAHQGQHMLGAYGYDYSLAMQSAAAAGGAAAGIPQQYFYSPQMFDPSQYMATALPGMQASTAMTCAGPTAGVTVAAGAAGTVLPAAAMYQSLGAGSASAVSGAVTTTTPALQPPAASYPAIQEQR